MASGFSEGLNDPQVLAEALEGIRIFDRQANEEFFGTPSEPGPIYEVARHAIDMFRQMDVLQFEMEPSDLVIHGILNE